MVTETWANPNPGTKPQTQLLGRIKIQLPKMAYSQNRRRYAGRGFEDGAGSESGGRDSGTGRESTKTKNTATT